jgi:hypothetical protein
MHHDYSCGYDRAQVARREGDCWDEVVSYMKVDHFCLVRMQNGLLMRLVWNALYNVLAYAIS